ncbi:MAG: hypothetical protein ONB48_20235 [candidate division KSB1 bacterium]|nr:hypothetical protein [candidate division KSB1 bacterium]MDZ7276217.1 hypothetical protein [candidate division KSB1 bacterium]MDZ7287977.1 hypothetical protein [candidate division KSB1 bacterium]MDZ7300010.1 hypothetical protein [candidate division KSB1 bacterium]MDZ7308237.1 hypothetical protein [candidate division KSB1 bacterium]
MMRDLLQAADHTPPMGDLFSHPRLSFCRALWATPLAGEEQAPRRRIIHARILQCHGPAKLQRLGVRPAQGYHKCGSFQDLDWVMAFRVLVWQEGRWHVQLAVNDLPAPAPDEVRWFDLDGVITSAVILEVRRCGIDNWWPSWNLVSGAFLLEGEMLAGLAPRREQVLVTEAVSLAGLPRGVTAACHDGEIRYRTRFLEIGFWLNRAGFSHLGLDEEGSGRTSPNLLFQQAGSFPQGVMLHPLASRPLAAPTLRYEVQGVTRVQGNRVEYELALPEAGQQYHLHWQIEEDRLLLRASRTATHEVSAWYSSAWLISLRPTVSPAHVLGSITRCGETGLLELPVLLHAPRFGTLRITASNNHALWRSDAFRPLDLTTGELKLGEIPRPEGYYFLPAGKFECELEFTLARPAVALAAGTPAPVAAALQKCGFTALTYRPDTATFSNNGASMHCPICMDNWSAITTRMGRLLPNLHAVDLLRDSLERWLEGGQGYTSGNILQHGVFHEAEDEYLLTGAACLLGLGEYLQHSGTAAWLREYREAIRRQLEKMQRRDLDGDGLIESRFRTGVSGTGQWSTCWFDVVSFGWKDAFSNAILYRALRVLAEVLPGLGAADLSAGLADWAAELRRNYRPTFFNPETGWLAGWRCAENKLHDYAFLFVNGAAVSCGLLDFDEARAIMKRLWQETRRVAMPDPLLGLPGNLWHIPDADLADIMQGYPHGYYQNGGRTMAQARHFVNALYWVGMNAEAEELLCRLCEGLARGLVFGGNKSGVDWRFGDDRPCGYEGLLTDQFGVLATALERYGRRKE